ncbi:hypothetical protein GCM10027396_30250 [Insolitispirillum peregrinum]
MKHLGYQAVEDLLELPVATLRMAQPTRGMTTTLCKKICFYTASSLSFRHGPTLPADCSNFQRDKDRNRIERMLKQFHPIATYYNKTVNFSSVFYI